MRFFLQDKYTLSLISIAHYQKLILRSLLFLLGLAIWVYGIATNQQEAVLNSPVTSIVLVFIACLFCIEMISRLIPSPIESMGCEKQFHRNLVRSDVPEPMLQSWQKTAAVAAVWLIPNIIIGAIYISGAVPFIDTGFMYLLCIAYSVCDMICILFFCPFQTWIMKNKCCNTCRIYNWDFPMMFTPLIFVPSIPTYIVLGIALTVGVVWEYRFRKHPERFSEATNKSLSCANCEEKLCRHKQQLEHYLKENRVVLQERGEYLSEKLRSDIAARQKKAAGLARELQRKVPNLPVNAQYKGKDDKAIQDDVSETGSERSSEAVVGKPCERDEATGGNDENMI